MIVETAWSRLKCRLLGHAWFAHSGEESYCSRPACRGCVYRLTDEQWYWHDMRIMIIRQIRDRRK